MFLALLFHFLHHSHLLSSHLIDFSFKCFDFKLALITFLHHSILLSVLLLGVFQLVLQILHLLLVNVIQFHLLLLGICLPEGFCSFLLELSDIDLVALNLLMILILHGFKQVVLKHLVGLLNGIQKLLLIFQVLVQRHDLTFLIFDSLLEMLIFLFCFFITLDHLRLLLLIQRNCFFFLVILLT